MKKRSVLLISISLLSCAWFIWSLSKSVKSSSNKSWSDQQIESMIQVCMNSVTNAKYADKQKSYSICKCSIDKLINKYSYDEIWAFNAMGKDKDTMRKIWNPIIDECTSPIKTDIKMDTKAGHYLKECREQLKPIFKDGNTKNVCNCFVPYLIDKYGVDHILSIDSMLVYEFKKFLECSK